MQWLTTFAFSGPASIVYDEGGNKEFEDGRDSQDEIFIHPSSQHTSRTPPVAPPRTHSMSSNPQTIQSPDEDHSMASTLMSRDLSTGQQQGDEQPDDHIETPTTNTSQTTQSPVEDHSMANTLMSRSLLKDQLQGDKQLDGYVETPAPGQSNSSSSHSNPKPEQMSPNTSNVSHHTVVTQPQPASPQSRNQRKLFNFRRPVGLRLYKVKE